MKPFVPTAYLPESLSPIPDSRLRADRRLHGADPLGFLTANLVGRSFINFGETALDRMPVVRGIYRGVKQIFETVFKQDGHSFRQVGLIEWPGEGLWSLCFITEPAQARSPGRCQGGSTYACSCPARRTRPPVIW